MARRGVRVWVLLALGVSLLAGGWWFPRAGAFLVVEDPFSHADIALILSGDPVRRSLAARDLYRQGRVGEILVIPDPPDTAREELVALRLVDPNLPSWPERILAASGVPRSDITLLPEPVDGTIREAQRVRAFLKDHPPTSIVIITSKFASRRARFIFRHVLKGTVNEVWCFPSPYDTFRPDRWWTQPRNALFVVMEYQKFLANALTLALGRHST